MEVWRQSRVSSEDDHSTTKGKYKTDLTLTGLLVAGLGWYSLLKIPSYRSPYARGRGRAKCLRQTERMLTTRVCGLLG